MIPFLANDQLLAAGRHPMPTLINRCRVGVRCGAVAHIDEYSAHGICAFQLGDNGPATQQFGHSITASCNVCSLRHSLLSRYTTTQTRPTYTPLPLERRSALDARERSEGMPTLV